jgi:hypothetical protein
MMIGLVDDFIGYRKSLLGLGLLGSALVKLHSAPFPSYLVLGIWFQSLQTCFGCLISTFAMSLRELLSEISTPQLIALAFCFISPNLRYPH